MDKPALPGSGPQRSAAAPTVREAGRLGRVCGQPERCMPAAPPRDGWGCRDVEAGAAEHLALEHPDPVDVSFDDA
ncbi:hypothetical protein ACIPRL_35005 [Streptomyces sp. NPDC090085]|uniref:hypothetical protein n=1 Tax=Streptomyces sp. NPDC090085 TaxID=3365943 RepID=UPI0037FB00C8